MRKIGFISPVEFMRGNLSGSQKLTYATNNNPAFDAPAGRQYANNYRPTFVGARRSKDGSCYFALKSKSATLIDSDSLLRMAKLGGGAAWFNACKKNVTVNVAMIAAYRKAIQDQFIPATTSLRKYAMDILMANLAVKAEYAVFGTTKVHNPWYWYQSEQAGQNYTPVDDTILVKFWLQLGCGDLNDRNPIYFFVETRKGIAFEGAYFASVIDLKPINVLNLWNVNIDEVTGMGVCMKDGAHSEPAAGDTMYPVLDSDGHVAKDMQTVINSREQFTLGEAFTYTE